MKIVAAFAIVITASACTSAIAQDKAIPLRDVPMPPVEARFPVTYDAAAISRAYADPDVADGENAAVEGEVVSVKNLGHGLPAVVLRVAPHINIVVLPSVRIEHGGFLQSGTRLRAMGYLRKTQDMVSLVGEEAGSNNPLSLMSLCIVQPKSLDGVFDQKYIELCAAWQKGKKVARLK